MTTLTIEMAVINVVAFAFALAKAVVRKATELTDEWSGVVNALVWTGANKAAALVPSCADGAVAISVACADGAVGLTGVALRRVGGAYRALWLSWRSHFGGVDNARERIGVGLALTALVLAYAFVVTAFFAMLAIIDATLGFTAGDALRYGAYVMAVIAATFMALYGFIYGIGLALALPYLDWGGVLARLEAYGDGRDLAASVKA